MKKALLKFLFSRQVGKIQDVLSKAVRHGITGFGGFLAGQGAPLSDPDMTTLHGAGTVLLGVGLAVVRTFVAAKFESKE